MNALYENVLKGFRFEGFLSNAREHVHKATLVRSIPNNPLATCYPLAPPFTKVCGSSTPAEKENNVTYLYVREL